MDTGLQAVVEAEGDERGRPLAVGGKLADLDAPIREPERLHPLRAVELEVLLGEPRRAGYRRGHTTAVERIRSLAGEELERPGDIGQQETAADLGGRIRRRRGSRPLVRDPGGAGDALSGDVGCPCERPIEPEAAEPLGEVAPGAHDSRNRHGARAEHVDADLVQLERRAAGAVEAVEPSVVPHERERISSQAVVGRLRDGQHRGRGERGVDRIASLAERRQTGCRGERMARRDHRPADDRRHPAPPAGSRGPGTEQGGKVELHPRILAVSPASIPCHHGGVNLKRPRTPHYDDPVAVGRRLHAAREAAGISQRDLAFPGCSAAYISRIERGERVPSLQVMRELARRIGISESVLAYGRDRIDAAVSDAVEAVEAAEAAGDRDQLAKAYRALSRAATHAAKSTLVA